MSFSTGSRAVEVRRLTKAEAQSLQVDVVELYRAAWSPTAFAARVEDLRGFGERFLRHCENPDFVMAVGRAGNHTAGFAYGYTSVPGGWWRQAVTSNLPDDLVGRWFDDCFEFAELAVDPPHQQKGLGAALHDELLRGLPHQTAVLSTQEDNQRARSFYARRGWVQIRDSFRFPHKHYPYIILGLELARRRPTLEPRS
jgi:ribosomal protein S18 acetylase RimI-like enzyme